jgi:hypothetical protein
MCGCKTIATNVQNCIGVTTVFLGDISLHSENTNTALMLSHADVPFDVLFYLIE